ncbi:MAG: c-type cytochrome [Elainellaceae cyanobacterium]
MVRRFLKFWLVAIAILLLNLLPTPAFAANPASGAPVFELHCAGCHVNGGNIIRRGKNLKLKTLQRQELDSEAAIAQIVTNGRGIMSAYGDRLTEQEIQDVAAYVLEQANQNWKS